jgi:hypothetical protein
MPNWEYKIITSGSLGFASPQLLEQHLNQLGREEWEIIHFQNRPENPLAFTGLARRPVIRDWVVEPAAAPAVPGFKGGSVPAPPDEKTFAPPSVDELRAEAEERRESLLAREESLRPLRGEAAEDEADDEEDLDDAGEDEELPTFFEAIRPHMRRNQKGPGMAVGIEYLAKKFEQTEADLIEAVKECGFAIPSGPKDRPVFLEYDGDLFWINTNNRGQLWINTREKPRSAFRAVRAQPAAVETPPERAEPAAVEPSRASPPAPAPAPAPSAGPVRTVSLPEGPTLLERLRPLMRRNRRGSGLSGSVNYLARALQAEPKALEAAFLSLGLALPSSEGDRPVFVDIGTSVYWLNQDKTGQVWINSRAAQAAPAAAAEEPAAASTTAPLPPLPELPLEPAAAVVAPTAPPATEPPAAPLAGVRLLLKETKRGGLAAEVGRVAAQLQKSPDDLLATLVQAGLRVPEKAREKPVFVEHAGEIFWLNRNARGELWINAKGSKYAEGAADDKESADAPAGDAAADKKQHRPRKKKEESGG